MNEIVIYAYKDYLSKQELALLGDIFENNFEKILKELDIKREFPKIEYYLYPSVEIKKRETGEDANAHTDKDKFKIFMVYNKEIKPTGPHELVHLLTSHLGTPNYLFAEGLAEYFEKYWKAEMNSRIEKLGHDQWVKYFLKNKKFISISDLFDDSKFWELDDEGVVSYPESGSFIKYLKRKYGLKKLMAAYTRLTRNGKISDNEEIFRDAFGATIQRAEKEWLDYIAKI